jgi:hypothetical protein
MILNASEESLIKVVRMLPADEAKKVLDWAQHLADLGSGRHIEGPIPRPSKTLEKLQPHP